MSPNYPTPPYPSAGVSIPSIAPGTPQPPAPSPAPAVPVAPANPGVYPSAGTPYPQAPYGGYPTQGYPPGWGQAQPGYPYQVIPPASSAKNKFGIMALVFGIITMVNLYVAASGNLVNTYSLSTDPGGYFGYLTGVLAFPVLAICMGITGVRACGRRQATNRGMAIAGMVMGIAFCAVVLLSFVAAVVPLS